MRITFQPKENIQNVMRRCGYLFIRAEGDELSFARPMSSSGSGYPRFHIYAKVDDVSRETTVNLHLDQKRPVYEGVTAHSGEYDGAIIANEVVRLKRIMGL